MFLLVRTEAEPMAMLASVREAVKRVDPYQPVYAIDTLSGRFASRPWASTPSSHSW